MFGIGTTELLIVLGIVIVLFGARRLPELGSGIGKTLVLWWYPKASTPG